MSDQDRRAAQSSVAKIAFGLGALICVLAGFLIYVFADSLGLDPDTANILAIAFLIAGVADYLVLKFWDRIMPSR